MLQRDGEWIPSAARKHEAHLNVMPPTPGFQRDLSAQKCMQIPGTFQREQAITLRKGRTRHRKACVGLDAALKRKNGASTPSGRETGKRTCANKAQEHLFTWTWELQAQCRAWSAQRRWIRAWGLITSGFELKCTDLASRKRERRIMTASQVLCLSCIWMELNLRWMMPTMRSISLGEMGRVRDCSLSRFITWVVNSLHAWERETQTPACYHNKIRVTETGYHGKRFSQDS